jgi:hypothetical protein
MPAVHGDRVRVYSSTITENNGIGVEGVKVKVVDSAVLDNGIAPECGVTHNCSYDVGSFKRPRVENTPCETSFDSRPCGGCPGHEVLTDATNPALHNWGVCASDPP